MNKYQNCNTLENRMKNKYKGNIDNKSVGKVYCHCDSVTQIPLTITI